MIHVVSFSYRDNPTAAPGAMHHDCRHFRNPYKNTNLRMLTGISPAVQQYVLADPTAILMLSDIFKFIALGYGQDPYEQTVAFGCTGGQHRSVSMAETLHTMLSTVYIPATVTHLNLKG